QGDAVVGILRTLARTHINRDQSTTRSPLRRRESLSIRRVALPESRVTFGRINSPKHHNVRTVEQLAQGGTCPAPRLLGDEARRHRIGSQTVEPSPKPVRDGQPIARRFDREISSEIDHWVLRRGQMRRRLIQCLLQCRRLAPDQHFCRDHPVTEPGPTEVTGVLCLCNASTLDLQSDIVAGAATRQTSPVRQRHFVLLHAALPVEVVNSAYTLSARARSLISHSAAERAEAKTVQIGCPGWIRSPGQGMSAMLG